MAIINNNATIRNDRNAQRTKNMCSSKYKSDGVKPTPENAIPDGSNAELQSILSELQDIQGLLRSWA